MKPLPFINMLQCDVMFENCVSFSSCFILQMMNVHRSLNRTIIPRSYIPPVNKCACVCLYV